MFFEGHIGIDYSGAGTSHARSGGLQVFASFDDGAVARIESPTSGGKRRSNWNRAEITKWLIEQARSGCCYLAGVDHGFSFPHSYFRRYRLGSWPAFLSDFVKHWPTHEPGVSVDDIRRRGPARVGESSEYRITEQWTSSARSVYHFDAQGQVAKSTHAGIPWLLHLRQQAGDRIHFWPFDGWDLPDEKSVVCEVFPSVLRRRYPREDRGVDEHDAFAIASWLRDSDSHGSLQRYAHPPLTEEQRKIAELEGWIFGIM